MKGISQKDTKQLGNAGEIKIRFGGGGVEGFSSLKAEKRLEGTDGAFHSDPLVVEGHPLIRIPEDTGVEAFVSIRIDVDTATVSGRSTWVLT